MLLPESLITNKTRSDRLTFVLKSPERLYWQFVILLSDEVITQGVVERAGEKPLGVKYVKHQVQSVSTHVINEHVFQQNKTKPKHKNRVRRIFADIIVSIFAQ